MVCLLTVSLFNEPNLQKLRKTAMAWIWIMWTIICFLRQFKKIGQNQPSRDVLRKRFSENIQQTCRRTPMRKCYFNSIEITLRHRCYSSTNLLYIFRTLFPKNTFGVLLLHNHWTRIISELSSLGFNTNSEHLNIPYPRTNECNLNPKKVNKGIVIQNKNYN